MATYIVKQGDSLSRIALRELGDESRWRELAALNALPDPDEIYIGQRLALPDPAAASGQPAKMPWETPSAADRTPSTPALQPPSQAGIGAGGPPWFPLVIIGIGALLFFGNQRR